MPKVLVPLADGVEEMEAVIVIDVLRRAGWEVAGVGLREGPVTASRGVKLVPDRTWSEVEPGSFDVLMLPGGAGGTAALAADVRVLEAVRGFVKAGKHVGAVCAGPLVLQAAGVLAGRRVTCHPAVAGKLTATAWVADRVVVDGKLVTSQGPGTSFEFVLAMVRLVDGPEKAREIAAGMAM